MKLVLSPAKTLDYTTKLPIEHYTESCFLTEAEHLNKLLKKKSAKQLSKLMHISETLGQLNYGRNQNWQLPFVPGNARQAVFAFKGDVYEGLNAYNIPQEKMGTLQKTVRIISGLYGVLKPLDLILPYRLEMGTKLPVGKHKNLYGFWQKKVTQALNDELKEGELFVNLASNEYYKAIDTKALKVPVLNVTFKDFKNGQYKTISFFAKKARGLMARYIIDTDARTPDDLKGFDYDGYAYDDNQSSAYELVFTR